MISSFSFFPRDLALRVVCETIDIVTSREGACSGPWGSVAAFVVLGAMGTVFAPATVAVPVDMSSYKTTCGVGVREEGDGLIVNWDTPEGATELAISLSGEGALVRSIAVASGEGELVSVLRDVDPATVLTLAERDLEKRNGWTIFFDHTDHKPRRTRPLSLKLEGVVVRSEGRRCVIDIARLEGHGFSGDLRFTVYSGCDLIHVQSVVSTEKEARALLYDAGLTCDPDGKSVAWIGLDDRVHRIEAGGFTGTPQKVLHRTIAVETETGGVAVFPPPHRYFYPLDEAYNLGFTWRGNDYLGHVSGFGVGIRQDPKGDKRWVPWFNAPPGPEQKLGIFWLASQHRGKGLFERVKAYTHGDRFVELDGYKTFTSHYHIEHATKVIQARENGSSDYLPPELEKPEFVDVFKNAGVQIVHLAEYHNRLGRERRKPRRAFSLLQVLHDECDRLSDKELLILPGEEPNVHLGGHWISFFPRPVMWSLGRPEGTPFVEDHAEFGRVYYVGSAEDVLELMEREEGLMWTAHPRIKSSTGYPDEHREASFFKSDHFLGGAWKAMPADLSRERLGWRVSDLLDDMANWGGKKQIVGEVDIFQVDRTTEFYAHANINYLRLDHVPSFEEGWGSVLEALRDGSFFISTGEVLMPRFSVGGKESGETLELDVSGRAKLQADLTWTFPMAFAEVISGDGEAVYRQRIDLSETSAFGEETLRVPLDLKGKIWVRLEAWDVACNGVISQPIWLHSIGDAKREK